jgi:predicted dehydrogenase
MANKKKVNIALIGHKFMGRAHSNGLRQVIHTFDMDVEPVMKILCGIGDDLEETAHKYGWESFETDWRKVVSNHEIDAVSICTPGALHAEIALEAAKNGKHILCEKPLSNSLSEAEDMTKAVNDAGVINVVNFCYRKVPAILLAKRMIDEGKLGSIVHFRAIYQQDWAAYEVGDYVWRFDNNISGGGAIADKGAHVIDLARFLVGEFDEVVSQDKIFYKYKENPITHEKKEVTSDDASNFIALFKSGATGIFQTSRISLGKKNALTLEINGTNGTIMFDLERLNEIEVYLEEEGDINGFKTVLVTEPSHSYISNWWPSGHIIGWEHCFVHQYYEFLRSISSNQHLSSTFVDGLKTQQIIEKLIESGKTKQWVKI